MKRCLNFAVLMGLLVPAGLLLAQTPARMALPTGGLNPPQMNSSPLIAPPVKSSAPAASSVPARAPIPPAAAPATRAPVLVAAQTMITAQPVAALAAAPAAAGNPFDLTPAVPAPAASAPATPAPATPAPAVPDAAIPAPTPLATPEFHFVQKPALPPATAGSTPRYGRMPLQQTGAPQTPNRIRDCLLKASDEVQLPAQEAGVLVELIAKEGHEVRQGQPLGRIDDSQPRIQKKAAEAERNVSIEKGKSTINEVYALKASEVARKEWEKAEESNRLAPNSVSQVEVMRLKLTWEKGLLERERAIEERKIENLTVLAKDVDVEATDDAIRRRQLVAPINGTVVEITPHVGEWLKPGDPVLKIVNLEILKIEGYVNIEHFRQDKLRNQIVDAYVDVGEKLPLKVKATITFVSPVVEAGGEYRIKAEIQNGKNPQTGDWYLKPGLNAELVISEETAQK